MGAEEVNAFLTHLVVSENVAASTQAQALRALLFLYKHVLGDPLPWLDDAVRAVSSASDHAKPNRSTYHCSRSEMKKRKRSTRERGPIVPGVGWYSREQYARLLEASEDKSEMSSTWEAWEAKAREMLDFLRSEGIPAREIPIDVEEMIRWCKAQGKPVAGAARAEFISLKCRELFGEKAGKS